MTIEIIRYHIPAGQEEAFEQMYAEAQQYLAASPHCLGYQLTHCLEEPQRYLLRIEWDSLDGHLQGFRQSPGFPKFMSLTGAYYRAIEEMQHYQLTSIASSK